MFKKNKRTKLIIPYTGVFPGKTTTTSCNPVNVDFK